MKIMGRRKKDSNSAPFFGDPGVMPEQKHIEMSPSTFRILKLVLYTLFDVSPAGAFLENSVDVVKGLPAPTASKKQSSNLQQKQLNSVPDQHPEASGSKSARYGVEKRTSILGSPQHGGGRLMKVFRRKSSKSKVDMRESNHSDPSSSDCDIYYNGDVSSDSLFELQVEGSLGTSSDYHDGKVKTYPQFKENPLESEVEVLRRRLEKQEEEVQKLKDELSSLRSSSGSSQVESPRSNSGTSGSEKSFAFDTTVSPSESSTTSTTANPFDSESQIFIEFRPSDEGQLVKLVQEEQTRSRICKPRESDDDKSFVKVEEDVPLVRRSRSRICNPKVSDGDVSSANAEEEVAWGRHSLSSLHSQGLERDRTLEHMDTFLADVAALSKHETLEKYTQNRIGFEYQRIDSQSPEGPRRVILANQYTKEIEPSLEVVPSISEVNRSNDDVEHARARSKKQEPSLEPRSLRFVSSDSSKTHDDGVQHDECPSKPAEEKQFIGVCSDGRVESGNLQELDDSERLSQEIEAHPRKISIMDLRVHDHDDYDNPEIDRRLDGLRETAEKFMKILLSPTREHSYGTTSSNSGTPPVSIANTSPTGSFMMRDNENSVVKVDVPANGCFDSCCNASVESLSTVVESGMQASRVTKSSIDVQVQNLDLSSPREILASRFGSLVKTRSLDFPRHVWEDVEDVQAEISEEAVTTSLSTAGEVYFHPSFSRDLSFSVLTGYKQQRDRTARSRGKEVSPAVARDLNFRVSQDKSAGTKLEEHVNVRVPTVFGSSGVSNTESDCTKRNDVRRTASGSGLTRFGEEAAKLAMQSLAQASSPDKLNCRPRYNRTRSCLPSEPGVTMKGEEGMRWRD